LHFLDVGKRALDIGILPVLRLLERRIDNQNPACVWLGGYLRSSQSMLPPGAALQTNKASAVGAVVATQLLPALIELKRFGRLAPLQRGQWIGFCPQF